MSNKKMIQPYKMFKGWKVLEEYRVEKQRKVVTLILGKLDACAPESEDNCAYEEIYEDILAKIITHKEHYTVDVNIGRTPQLTILKEGSLIRHNGTVKTMLEEIEQAIQSIQKEILYRAYYELRLNQERFVPVEEAGTAMIHLVNAKTNNKYSRTMIRTMLYEAMEHDLRDIARQEDTIGIIKGCSNQEFLFGYTDLVTYLVTKEVRSDLLKEVLELIDGEQAKPIFEEELICRFLTGKLTIAR